MALLLRRRPPQALSAKQPPLGIEPDVPLALVSSCTSVLLPIDLRGYSDSETPRDSPFRSVGSRNASARNGQPKTDTSPCPQRRNSLVGTCFYCHGVYKGAIGWVSFSPSKIATASGFAVAVGVGARVAIRVGVGVGMGVDVGTDLAKGIRLGGGVAVAPATAGPRSRSHRRKNKPSFAFLATPSPYLFTDHA